MWDVTESGERYTGTSWFLLTHPVWDVTTALNHLSRRVKFLLTHPVWDVTSMADESVWQRAISTHTSRVGCDVKQIAWAKDIKDFYSHIPCGMWQYSREEKVVLFHFYSHIPCGMWRGFGRTGRCDGNFYSHIPCGMWPCRSRFSCIETGNFYSHIPCGMWLKAVRLTSIWLLISTHTSRVGCDYITEAVRNFFKNFYSHIPCGMWRSGTWGNSGVEKFLLTHPVWDVTAIYSIFQSHYSHILQDGPIIHLELY